MAETSTKPYLIRAIHEWCSDNGFTPYIAVAVDSRTVVPREFVRNGEIVLNVSVMATHRLKLGNDFIEFQARFGGTPRELSIPVENVSAVYARENGHGMAFEVPKVAAVVDADAAIDAPVSSQPAPLTPPRPTSAPLKITEPASGGSSGGGLSGGSAGGSAGSSTERTRPRPALRSAKPASTPVADGGRGTSRPGGQLLAVVPDGNDPGSGNTSSGSQRTDDEPPEPTDNPPKQSRAKLTRIK